MPDKRGTDNRGSTVIILSNLFIILSHLIKFGSNNIGDTSTNVIARWPDNAFSSHIE